MVFVPDTFMSAFMSARGAFALGEPIRDEGANYDQVAGMAGRGFNSLGICTVERR
jgi:hypothetical protein